MGRAIVRDPKAFLMDEPLSNLDAKLRVQMRSEISRLQDKLGTTTVYVTHDQTEAMTLGDRVVVLLAGVAQQIGTPEELYNRPANLFVAGFIGSPAMNFFPATMTDVGVRLPRRGHTDAGSARPACPHQHADQRDRQDPAEHLEHAAVLTGTRVSALTFDVTVDIVESLGAEQVSPLHNRRGRHRPRSSRRGGGVRCRREEYVARVSTTSQAKQGDTIQFAFDASKLTVFDVDTSRNLSLPDDVSSSAPAPMSLVCLPIRWRPTPACQSYGRRRTLAADQ